MQNNPFIDRIMLSSAKWAKSLQKRSHWS